MADETEPQVDLEFPDPEEFPSYDDVDSEDGEAELPQDSFDASSASNDEQGCGCVQ